MWRERCSFDTHRVMPQSKFFYTDTKPISALLNQDMRRTG